MGVQIRRDLLVAPAWVRYELLASVDLLALGNHLAAEDGEHREQRHRAVVKVALRVALSVAEGRSQLRLGPVGRDDIRRANVERPVEISLARLSEPCQENRIIYYLYL